MRGQDQQSRVFYELCALLLSILRPPPAEPLPMACESSPSSMAVSPPRRMEVSPAGVASLLLGVSLTLMLCGSVTFVIGFMLMPWVLGLVTVFYLVGTIILKASHPLDGNQPTMIDVFELLRKVLD